MKMSMPKESPENNGLLTGRPVIATEFQGFKVATVGNRLYTRLPKDITFHEFLVTVLKDVVGIEWGMIEQKKPKEQRHIIVQWIEEMADLLKNSEYILENAERDLRSSVPSGNVVTLLSLAYDVYSVLHCADLPEELVSRLKNSDQFQGAKYEIAVAAIFARAGFIIEWIPKSTKKICEFRAIERETGQRVIVEAKSRHRQGVLNRPGQREDLDKMRSQIGTLYNQALSKDTEELPYFIFIDINLPHTPVNNPLNRRWVNDIRKLLDGYPDSNPDNPDIFNGLFITNFSWHYTGAALGVTSGESLSIIPLFTRHKLQNSGLLDVLRTAVNQYGIVPPLFPEDTRN
jgi:hypothetical protein